jgi:hypothetical protein
MATPGGADIRVRVGNLTGLDASITRSKNLPGALIVELSWACRALDWWTFVCLLAMIPILVLQIAWTIHDFDPKDILLDLLPPFALRSAEKVLVWLLLYVAVYFFLLYLGKIPLRLISLITEQPFRKPLQKKLFGKMIEAAKAGWTSESERE